MAARTALASKRDLSGASVSLGSVERILNDEQDIAHRLIAFYIMSVNLACSAHHPELVGYRRAGLSLGKGLTTIKKAWRRFSPVAHLLVAPSYCPHDGEQAPDEWLLEMLAYAEEIRRRGESIYPHGQQVQGRPLLDPERTWTCPEDLMLPPAELQIEPLSEGVLAALKGVGR